MLRHVFYHRLEMGGGHRPAVFFLAPSFAADNINFFSSDSLVVTALVLLQTLFSVIMKS